MTEQQPEAPALPGVTRWRNRPVEVSAIQWTGSNDDEAGAFAGDVPGTTMRAFKPSPRADPRCAMLWTAPGRYRQVEPGDWILRLPGGSLGVAHPEEFAAAYEPAGEPLTTVLCPTCLHDGALERTLERARAAEARLAAIEAHLPAAVDALSASAANAEYECQAKPYLEALEALGGGEEGNRG